MPKMDEFTLKGILQAQKADALAGQNATQLANQRTKALEYYNGDMSSDMPTVEGRSAAVSTDVSDTVEGLMPAMMEIFAGSDEIVRFEPTGPEDVPQAEQE